MQFTAYQRESNGALVPVPELGVIIAASADAALHHHATKYGDNYGKIVLLPTLTYSKHVALAETTRL